MFTSLIWLPTKENIPRYKGMGIDAGVFNGGLNPNQDLKAFEDVCKANDFGIWRYPASKMVPPSTSSDIGSAVLRGTTVIDEPVLHGRSATAWLQQGMDNKVPGLPVLGNLEGDKFSKTLAEASIPMRQGLKLYMDCVDICLCDFYAFNRVRYTPDKQFISWYGLDAVMNSFNLMRNVDPTKSVGIVIEASNQCIDSLSRAPTVQEFRGSLWLPFLAGASYVMLFPQRPGNKQQTYEVYGDSNDAIPPELELEFVLNLPHIKEVDSWGKPSAVTVSDLGWRYNYPGGKTVFIDSHYNIQYSFGGSNVWLLDNQSVARKNDGFGFVAQKIAQARLDGLRANDAIRDLTQRLKASEDKLTKIRGILTGA